MSSTVVDVATIEKISPHPGADRLALAQIKGWQSVIRKNEDGSAQFAVGDKVGFHSAECHRAAGDGGKAGSGHLPLRAHRHGRRPGSGGAPGAAARRAFFRAPDSAGRPFLGSWHGRARVLRHRQIQPSGQIFGGRFRAGAPAFPEIHRRRKPAQFPGCFPGRRGGLRQREDPWHQRPDRLRRRRAFGRLARRCSASGRRPRSWPAIPTGTPRPCPR